jgi:hypothetical protein
MMAWAQGPSGSLMGSERGQLGSVPMPEVVRCPFLKAPNSVTARLRMRVFTEGDVFTGLRADRQQSGNDPHRCIVGDPL